MGSTAYRLALVVFGLLSARCTASMNVKAEGSASTPQDDRRWEVPEATPDAAPPAPPVVATGALSGTELEAIGVTHDLSLRPEAARTPSCTCLAVAYGRPADPRFLWESGPPLVGSQMIAIAISGDLDCRATDAKGRAPPKPSIAGVGREGDDIVITVEGAEGGRPVVRGALAVHGIPGAAIVIRAKGSLPYGWPIGSRSGVCRIPMK